MESCLSLWNKYNGKRAETSVPRGNLIPIYDRFTWLLHDSYFMCARFRYSFLQPKRSIQNYENVYGVRKCKRMEWSGVAYNTNVLKWKIAFYDGICVLVCANQFRFWWHNVQLYPMKIYFAYSFESCQWKYVCAVCISHWDPWTDLFCLFIPLSFQYRFI